MHASKHTTSHRNWISSKDILGNSNSLNHKLSLKIRQSCLDFLARSTTWLTTTTPSTNCLPLRKTYWLDEMILSIIEANLEADTLSTSLYKEPKREIRWNSTRDWGELTLGIKATKRSETSREWGVAKKLMEKHTHLLFDKHPKSFKEREVKNIRPRLLLLSQ